MRIWDLPPTVLCRQHLLGEHRELHAIWTILTQNKSGYRKHPETKRWEGKYAALYQRHEQLVEEMHARGYNHKTPLQKELAVGATTQKEYVDTPSRQKELLKGKHCDCHV